MVEMEHQTNTESEEQKMDFEKYSREDHPLTPPSSPEKVYPSEPIPSHYLQDSNGRRCRTAFSKMQLCILEDEFFKDHYISRQKRKELSELLQLPEHTIKVWFQNRRMKEKREKVLAARWPYGSMPMGGPFLPAYPPVTYAAGFAAPPHFPPLSYSRWQASLPEVAPPHMYMLSRPLLPAPHYLGLSAPSPLDMSGKLSPCSSTSCLRPPAY